jgi:hypothetical protein
MGRLGAGMRTGPRTIAVALAALVAGLAVAGYAAARTPPATGGGPPVIEVPAPCGPSRLSATYTLDPFSQGAGHVAYTLTITNRSKRTCALPAPLPLRLLGKSGKALPTHASTSPGGHHSVPLAPGQWAQADSRFSPDISGPGEGNPCEPSAHSLRLAIGAGRIVAPMDPTPVCEHGQIAFARLRAVTIHPACTAAGLTATFKRVAKNGGGAEYGLALRNAGAAACYLDGAPGLRLLKPSGRWLPTHEVATVPYAIVVGSHHRVSLLATFASISRPGPGEPRHGPCEPRAAAVRIRLRPGGSVLTTVLAPPATVCRRGLITVSGLVPGYPFA